MLCIGTDADESFIRRLAKKYTEAGYLTDIHSGSRTASDIQKAVDAAYKNGCKVFISPIDNRGLIKYDMVIFVKKRAVGNFALLKSIKKNGYVIINADDYDTFPFLIPNGVRPVTCGINRRAALTFSGISENITGRETVQCCIQKEIRTFSGRLIGPQEFSVHILGKYELSEVLAIITAVIMGDIEETVTSEELFFSK